MAASRTRVAASRTRPARLRPGDRVAVVATSGPLEPDRLDAGCALLRGLGLDVVVGAHALDRSGFLAGRDADRAADLQGAWCDPTVRAVLCARGGYGATRLLDLLDWDALAAAAPKLLHGFSDITALHAAFGARLGVVSTAGPMVASALLGTGEPEPVSFAHLRDTLLAPERVQTITSPGVRALVPGRTCGVLTGGNLAVLVALLGTPYAPPPAAGAIVTLEDVEEEPYRIDRMLTQLLQAGWFDGAAGLVLGTWTDCGDPDEVDAVLAERLTPLGVPTLAGLAFGHGSPQLTIPLGVEAELDAAAGTLTLAEPALR